MRIVARKQQRVYLLALDNDRGQILDVKRGLLFPPFNIHSLITHGGPWEEYRGDQGVLAALLAQVTPVPPPSLPPRRSREEVENWLREQGFWPETVAGTTGAQRYDSEANEARAVERIGRDELLRPDPVYESLPSSELLPLLQHRSAFTRARVLGTLARRLGSEPALAENIYAAMTKPTNRDARTVGAVSVTQFGLAVLLSTAIPEAHGLAREYLATLPAAEQAALMAWLQAAGTQDDTGATPR